ncbi:RusA family crossover junction endodeoxyribonuclease [soil metagenome]
MDLERENGAAWVGRGKVRAREFTQPGDGRTVEVVVDGLTTQAKYYKPLIHEFFRKEWRGGRPAFGDFTVEIVMEYFGDPPWMDLDNLAKAVLDAIKGHVFVDDAQVCRLLVERVAGERERVMIRVNRLAEPEPGRGA